MRTEHYILYVLGLCFLFCLFFFVVVLLFFVVVVFTPIFIFIHLLLNVHCYRKWYITMTESVVHL